MALVARGESATIGGAGSAFAGADLEAAPAGDPPGAGAGAATPKGGFGSSPW